MHACCRRISLSLVTYYCLPAQIYVALGRKEGGALGWVKREKKKTSRRLLRLGRAPRVRSSKVKGKSVGKGAGYSVLDAAGSKHEASCV